MKLIIPFFSEIGFRKFDTSSQGDDTLEELLEDEGSPRRVCFEQVVMKVRKMIRIWLEMVLTI